MRLIDADNPKLRSALYTYIRFSGIYEAPDEHADQELDFVPTVEERKKGEWQSIKSYPNIIFCNECGTAFMRDSTIWNFCPNCGADMRGKKNETD